jgi:uncharacterized protein YcbK (DUF882 family)
MGDVSANFSRAEFACKCGNCRHTAVDTELLSVLERVREWGGPVTITSANRCPEYNAEIDGHPDSYHIYSMAADIVVTGRYPHQVYNQLEIWYPYAYGLGSYDNFTHIDVQTKRKRWEG